MFLAVFGERFVLLRELFEQRRGRPEFAVLTFEFADAIINLFQTDHVGVPHGTTAVGRVAIAGDVDDVDVHGAKRAAECPLRRPNF